MAMDADDPYIQIEKVMADDKEWKQLSKFLKKKFIPEVITFHNYNLKYQNEKDAAKRKELATRMIVKFLTLDGDATLADHNSCSRDLKRKLKRLKNKPYPPDLFLCVHDKCVSTISNIWDEYLATKK